MRRLALAIACTLAVGGCSTVETSGGASLGSLAATDRIQLKVRTGKQQMDHLLYEMAYQQLADVIPLREAGPYTGSLELTFASSTQSGFLGSTSGVANVSGAGSSWYTGGGYAGTLSGTVSTATISSGTVLEWQNSTMLAVLRGADGERLWSADYNYKGGWEMSGWVVNTPEEAARLVVKRLKARYVADRSGKAGSAP